MKNMILESMYEVIKESTEWGVGCKDVSYGEYVDGVVAMTEAMLEKEKNKKIIEEFKNSGIITIANDSADSECIK